jgi:tRNA (cmo5U34)-methyltransferase
VPLGNTSGFFSSKKYGNKMKDFQFSKDMVGENFNSHVREQLPFYEMLTDAVAMIVRNYLPENGLVYDIGASTGNITSSIKDFALFRNAKVESIERSEEMSKTWNGHGVIHTSNAIDFDYEEFDVCVCFLVLMFMSVDERKTLLRNLKRKLKQGGVIIIVDKLLVDGGYFGTVMRRLTLDWKLKNGATPEQIITKELSLSGVQRPMSKDELAGGLEFFKFGEFVGWVIEG